MKSLLLSLALCVGLSGCSNLKQVGELAIPLIRQAVADENLAEMAKDPKRSVRKAKPESPDMKNKLRDTAARTFSTLAHGAQIAASQAVTDRLVAVTGNFLEKQFDLPREMIESDTVRILLSILAPMLAREFANHVMPDSKVAGQLAAVCGHAGTLNVAKALEPAMRELLIAVTPFLDMTEPDALPESEATPSILTEEVEPAS